LKKQNLKSILLEGAERSRDAAGTWEGKLAIVGSAGAGNNLKDMGATPVSRHDHLVTAHWNIAHSVLSGTFTREQPLWGRLSVVLALAVVSGWVSWRLRAFWASVIVLVIAGAYVAVVTWVFQRWRIWVPMVLPVCGALLMTHAAMVGYRTLVEGAHRRKVKSLFGRIVAPDVLDALTQLPRYPVETIHREVTVFFADIRGFTAFTDQHHLFAQEKIAAQGLEGKAAATCVEQHAAQALSTVNEYLTAIVDAIKRHGGTLDKYIGDCVMAFWGAPLGDARHASHAVQAAIDAQRAVHALNARRQRENEALGRENRRRTDRGERPEPLLATLSLGVSVHSGPMTVGFMGSDKHLSNYTVFGREVNIASRLEHMVASGCILATARTRDAVESQDRSLLGFFHERNEVNVKGVLERLRVYEVTWKV
jgi:adenylate cyclase